MEKQIEDISQPDAVSDNRRERKKRMRRAELMVIARRSFAELGFDRTSMESIAAEADIAVGTLYNYFPTKGDLLFAILSEDIAPIVGRARPTIEVTGEAALLALIRECFEWFDRYDRGLLRRFTADALTTDATGREGYFLFDDMLVARVTEIVAEMEERGALREGVDRIVAAQVIFNLGNAAFFAYLVDPSATADTVVATMAAQLRLVLAGFGRMPSS